MSNLKAPFPYFGGKSTVADTVWAALGPDIKHYIEPFFGSGAVLLKRPQPFGGAESVNDKDGFLCNVWRSLQFAPDEVAKWCDWPVNHADLMARRKVLIANEENLLANLVSDAEWYDAKMAGYWIWAASCWIGSGLTRPNAMPHIGSLGMGVHKGQIPHISNLGMGVHQKQITHIIDSGKGVYVGKCPHLSDKGTGKGINSKHGSHIYDWFQALSERLRNVRVVCGDWNHVCGGNWQDKMGICGMFFDPPYGVMDRDTNIYRHDSTTMAADVMEWVRERGQNENYRIVLAGYEEYESLLTEGWTSMGWKAQGGYANSGKGKNKENRHRETLYFSPHCLKTKQQMEAF